MSWRRFISMLLGQLAGAESHREICAGISCCLRKLRRLFVSVAPNKFTVSYADKHRPSAMFEELFMNALERFRALGELGPGRHTFRFKNQVIQCDRPGRVCVVLDRSGAPSIQISGVSNHHAVHIGKTQNIPVNSGSIVDNTNPFGCLT